MGLLLRLYALLTGYRVVILKIAPKGAGYYLLTSPHLPGFSLMLHPDDFNSATALSGAVEGPLKSFIEAEFVACHSQKRVQMKGVVRASEAKLVAGYCAA